MYSKYTPTYILVASKQLIHCISLSDAEDFSQFAIQKIKNKTITEEKFYFLMLQQEVAYLCVNVNNTFTLFH